MMKIVVLDAFRVNPGDLSWKRFEKLGDITVYDKTEPQDIINRCDNAEIVLNNKVKLTESHFKQLPSLNLICQLATGYDNVNVVAARTSGVSVCNAVGYSTHSVAQHVLALVLNKMNNVSAHNGWVQDQNWSKAEWSHTLSTLHEVNGQTLGIYGFGKIGQRVAELGMAFGMKILAHHKHPIRDAREGVTFVSLEELFKQSDIVTLHAPLSASNNKIINQDLLSKMSSDAMLINTGRGGLIHELDLRNHLLQNLDFHAALDVLNAEPPQENHPLIGLPNCVITPHNAWSTLEARKKMLDIVADNVTAFVEGRPQNIVN